MEHFELAVVGGGQAGASAACEAARLGVKVTLIDENPVSTEWMRLQVPLFYGTRIPESLTAQQVFRWLEQQPLLQEAVDLGVDVRTQHAVWGSFPDRTLGIYHDENTWLAQADCLICATGAGDVPLAFPGWTLPGVMGAAGAKALLDVFGYLQSRRLLILGSGNLAMSLARQVRQAGIKVAGVVEVGPGVRGDQALARELEQAGVPVFLSHTIKEARGQLEVEEAVLVRIDEQSGAPVSGSERVVAADTICLALGLAPAMELLFLNRCETGYDPSLGGYFPLHNSDMQTTQPGIFVAGSAAGYRDTLAGGEIAAQQGILAAIAAAESLGKLEPSEALPRKEEVRARLKELTRQPANTYQRPGDGFAERWLRTAFAHLAPDDLQICRCEEVSIAAVLKGLEFVSVEHPDEVKRVTRCGMGYCQGRDCRTLLAGWLALRTGRSPGSLPAGSLRAPVRPIKLAALATEEWTEYDRQNALEIGAWMRGWYRGLC